MTAAPEPSLPPLPPTAACPHRWAWRGWQICYQQAGSAGPAVVLVHGFGATWQHWRKNIPFLAQHCRVFALDLLGFGNSAKPTPGVEVDYTFETWGTLVVDFVAQVVGEPVVLVGNSIGCVVVMQAAVDAPQQVQSIALLNCSLRLLHDRLRGDLPWFKRWGTPLVQKILAWPWLGEAFFRQLATPGTVRKILLQAYCDPEAVTDELVEILLAPSRDPGAAAVFLAFTRYSQGPLPQDLLAQLTCPVAVFWGAADPWEPVELGREFERFACVERFVPIEQVGHCPQDEAPQLVNYLLRDWLLWQTGSKPLHLPLTIGDWVEIAVQRPDGDRLWNGLRGQVVQVGDRAVTVLLEQGQGRRHFYREDVQGIPEPKTVVVLDDESVT